MFGRSREGAWIEIFSHQPTQTLHLVAPVRERGLKSDVMADIKARRGRSREGAWIEIDKLNEIWGNGQSLP